MKRIHSKIKHYPKLGQAVIWGTLFLIVFMSSLAVARLFISLFNLI